MTLLESFLTVLGNMLNVIFGIVDYLLFPTIIVLLIVWLVQRNSVKTMIRMYGSDKEYDGARAQLVSRSKPVMVLGWILFAIGMVVLLGGLTWVTYVDSNDYVSYSGVWSMTGYIILYSVLAWFSGLCMVFARFVYIEVKSLRMLRARQVAKQTTQNGNA